MEKSSVKAVLKVFWKHIRRYASQAGLLMALYLILHVTEVIIPIYYKHFFDALTQNLAGTAAVDALFTAFYIIIGLKTLSWALWRATGLMVVTNQSRIMTDLKQTSFDWLLGHSHHFFVNNFAGSLVRKVHRLARAFEDITDQFLFNLLPLIISTVGIVIVLAWTHPALALAIALWVLVFVTVNYFIARWKQKYDILRAAKDSEETGVLADALTNSATIQLFAHEPHESGLFRKIAQEVKKIQMFSWNLNELVHGSQAFLMLAIEVIVMYLAIGLWRRGALTVGDFVLIQTYLLTLFHQLQQFGRIIRRFYAGFADGKEMAEILNTPHGVVDVSGAAALRVSEGGVEFRNVSFAFHETRDIIKDFSLTVRPGEKIALVGPSGAGKSTITKLLLRLYDIPEGVILIDGQNIASVTQSSLRRHIALVPQEPILFHRTLIENIRYGRLDATDAEVKEAAEKAHCDEFIEKLPKGYETYVGERGVKLSGGERQRVAIARAILKNAPILILDEATSSLDSRSEALIQKALKELMRGKTVLVIAHRLSTVMQMDRIIVIDKGKVATEGTHAELSRKDGLYKTLWDIQKGGFIS